MIHRSPDSPARGSRATTARKALRERCIGRLRRTADTETYHTRRGARVQLDAANAEDGPTSNGPETFTAEGAEDAENGKNGATSNGPETFTAEGAEDAEN
jgi:hypothetical protein